MSLKLPVLLAAAALISASPALARGNRASPRPSETASAVSQDLDHALRDFQASAHRLGNAMSKAADENTTEVRHHLMKTMSSVMEDLSKMMNRTAQKLEPSPRPSR